MPRLEVPIRYDGPLVEVRLWIGPEFERTVVSRRLPVPTPLSVLGLIDTGAERTAIPVTVAQGMGLPIHNWQRLKSSVLGDEERDAPVYRVRMTFGSIESTDQPKWRTIDAVGVNVVSPGATALVGRDLLATCRFTYDGRKRRLMMSY